MRERNWSEYNKQLIQRGSLTFLIDPKMIKELKTSATRAKAKVGRPQEFSNRLIELLAIIKVHFKMAYRFLEGFAKSFLIKFFPGLKLPTYSLICKRVATIELSSLPLSKGGTIVLDSTGMKVTGGEPLEYPYFSELLNRISQLGKWFRIATGGVVHP